MAKIAASLQSEIQPRRPLRQTDTIIVLTYTNDVPLVEVLRAGTSSPRLLKH